MIFLLYFFLSIQNDYQEKKLCLCKIHINDTCNTLFIVHFIKHLSFVSSLVIHKELQIIRKNSTFNFQKLI